MNYEEYFRKFTQNDNEEVIQYIPNSSAEEFLLENAPRLFCPDPNRGRDYNHSTFIDLVIRGLCGVDIGSKELTVSPKIKGIWKWFKLENLTFRKNTYTVYYDEDGSVFGKGCGVIIEKTDKTK